MKMILQISGAVAVLGGLGALTLHNKRVTAPSVGTHPGGVQQGSAPSPLVPAKGNMLIGFSAGCFWGAEQAFRKVPGVVATSVGYTGGSSAYPTYEVAHQTGHLETVLVEFNPQKTSLTALLKVFWTLPRAKNFEAAAASKSAYRASIWTYNSDEQQQAVSSRKAMEQSIHYKLGVKIQSALPFYLAEEYHQQYDEKSGKDLCPALP